jgi:hypothetical protein
MKVRVKNFENIRRLDTWIEEPTGEKKNTKSNPNDFFVNQTMESSMNKIILFSQVKVIFI